VSKVIILTGLPASGKTTWAITYMQTHPNTKRVNKDDLRAMIDDSEYSGDKEKFILQIRDTIILTMLKKGFDVIVDDTNLSPKHVNRIKAITPNTTEIIINDEFLNISMSDCIIRDQQRDNPVGTKVIERMYNQFLSKRVMSKEEKSRIWFETNTRKKIEYIPYDDNLEDCIIVDIDGTLALHNGRSPFDLTRVLEDLPNIPVINLVHKYYYVTTIVKTTKILLVSGREDTVQVREDTVEWLKNYGISFNALYMRPEGDYRKDVIIKKEIYEEYIEKKYNVLFVLDDRNQTIKGWRELNLPAFQVAEGNF